MAQSAFYYYNSEPALEQSHPGPFASHPSPAVATAAMHRFQHQQQQQQQQPLAIYPPEMMVQQRRPQQQAQSSQPSSSTSHLSQSMYMAPTSYVVPSAATPSRSPQPGLTRHALTKPAIVYGPPSQPLSLDTECSTMGYEYPATPALSASGSTAGSPPTNPNSVATPTHAAFFHQLESSRPASDVESKPENLAGEASWTRCGSPPLTPVLASSPPRNPPRQDALLALSATSCPSLSRSASPVPRSVTSDPSTHFAFCDPRSVFDSPHSVASAPQFDLPPLDLYAPHGEEYTHNLTFDAATTRAGSYVSYNASLPHVAPAEQFSDLDSEADLHDMARYHTSPGMPMTLKRQHLDHLAYSDDGFASEDSWGEFDEMNRLGVATLYSNPAYSALHPAAAELKPKNKKRCLTNKRATSASPNVRHPRSATEELSEPESTLSAYTDPAPSMAYAHTALANAHSHPPHHSAHHHPVARRGRKQSLTADPSKTFVCTLCARRFRRQEHLKRHYRSLHTHDKPFACTDCGKTFSRSDNLAQHARTHGSGAVVMGVLEEGELLARSGDEAFGGSRAETVVEVDGR